MKQTSSGESSITVFLPSCPYFIHWIRFILLAGTYLPLCIGMLTWHQREGRRLYMNRGIMQGVKPRNEAVLCLQK